PCSPEVIPHEQLATADWDGIALLVWHAPLPEGDAAGAVQAFVRRGGHVLFLPPRSPSDAKFLGARWPDWSLEKTDGAADSPRGDQDLLANTQSGAALPVGKLQVRRTCGLAGDVTPLARLYGGRTLLARVPTGRGGAYFLTTTPDLGDSSLASNG